MRTFLLIMASLVSLTTLSTGLFLTNNPDGRLLGLDVSLLEYTPFKDYFIPGVLLAVLVGLPHLIGIFFMMDRQKVAYRYTLTGGLLLFGWIIFHVVFFQTVFWIHGIFLAIAVLITLSSYQLMGKAAF